MLVMAERSSLGAVVNPQFARPFKYLPVEPRSLAEAIELSEQIKRDREAIAHDLASDERKRSLAPAEYLLWERRARRAKWIKEQQLGELRAWRAARTPLLEPLEAEDKRAARRAAHAARMRAVAEQAGVSDPRDPAELLRLARSVFIALIEDGVEFSADEQALFDVIREYVQDREREAPAERA
jgi:hypothetical protein